MDFEAAIRTLAGMVAADEDPTLSEPELEQLLTAAARTDKAGNPPTNVATASSWTSGTVTAGTVIKAGLRYWRCETPGTTGATEPAWSDLSTVSGHPTGWLILDGTVVWADNGTTWAPTWSLDAAAAMGWDRKAGKAASRYDFQTGDQTFSRSQQVAQFREMARMYRARIVGAARVVRG